MLQPSSPRTHNRQMCRRTFFVGGSYDTVGGCCSARARATGITARPSLRARAAVRKSSWDATCFPHGFGLNRVDGVVSAPLMTYAYGRNFYVYRYSIAPTRHATSRYATVCRGRDDRLLGFITIRARASPSPPNGVKRRSAASCTGYVYDTARTITGQRLDEYFITA